MGCTQSKVEANPPSAVPKPVQNPAKAKDEPTPVLLQDRVLPEKCACVPKPPVTSPHLALCVEFRGCNRPPNPVQTLSHEACRYGHDITSVYNLGKVLGKGQFGTTRIAIHKNTGEKYACKTISKRKLVKQQVGSCHM